MAEFSFLNSVIAGILIGISATAMLLLNGKIAGISGILSGILLPKQKDYSWQLLFLAGMLIGGAVVYSFSSESFLILTGRSTPTMIVAGLLIGFGARLGSGCTSGHAVCGVGRVSPRSIVAATLFGVVGAMVVFLYNSYVQGVL